MAENSLKNYFPDEWYKFTCDVMDESKVQSITSNSLSPDNAPHISDEEKLVAACREFMKENGEEHDVALDFLKSRKS